MPFITLLMALLLVLHSLLAWLLAFQPAWLFSAMSVKVAIFYNCVSSIFAVIGLVAGLLLGVHASFSTWPVSSTVGVFLYVALVSMMTELQGRGVGKAILNTAGMICGAVLLLFIGLYEHDLLSLFTD